VWDIILPKLQCHTKPHPPSIHDIISIQKQLKLCPSTQTPHHLVWTLFWINMLPLSSDSLLKTQAVYFSDTLLPRPHVILTQTILFFFTTVKTLGKVLWNRSDNSVGGSRWEHWMTSITLFSLPTLFNAALLYITSVLQFHLLPQMKQERKEI
jgi:hypothetical protein